MALNFNPRPSHLVTPLLDERPADALRKEGGILAMFEGCICVRTGPETPSAMRLLAMGMGATNPHASCKHAASTRDRIISAS